MACIKCRRRINALQKMVWAFVASTNVLPACLLLLVINCIIAVKYISIVRNTNSEAHNINSIAANPSTPKAMMLKRCYRLISGAEKLEGTVTNPPTDVEFLFMYAFYDDCDKVLSDRFGHPPVSEEEKELPIAYSITIYKSARLFERILRAIYMPNNVYCVHIDKKSSELFVVVIKAIIRCLPNVFVATNRTSVLWGHFSLVQAQLNCMEELSQSPVKWKYYISLVGQDFPLYDNREIVRALRALKNHNNIDSFPMPKHSEYRTKFVYDFINGDIIRDRQKPPPPHNITIFKGATHIIAIREFVNFVLHSQIAKDLFEFLNDTFIPDESAYSTLQQHPLAPGGIRGSQPEWIARAFLWTSEDNFLSCKGFWMRGVCWISFQDLQWAFGEENKMKLFVHKIPFYFRDELLNCILVVRYGRKYGTPLWKEEIGAV
ncbi:beta-1,3-galactosyl-O-glycosyl-glycoprotein beta-1,6-N-acetylglucosaminyltransferase 3-like [Montipora capricornis]|uniref:beta-1,3-galactosyl-O-glycosyl-glycoprotein beta-1,6-N-acetylglucosaminyltransferase 3-like n=1 Tax=Montipora capricornis TaxID=246305 RepID=UPI0035F0FDD5